jgi:hypothetical protein
MGSHGSPTLRSLAANGHTHYMERFGCRMRHSSVEPCFIVEAGGFDDERVTVPLGGLRSIVAESVLIKHQLLIVNCTRRRAPAKLIGGAVVANTLNADLIIDAIRRTFDHAEWIFELNSTAFEESPLENGEDCLVSRNGNTFASFRDVAAEVTEAFGSVSV